jgi:hypothetical protein
MSEMVEDFVNPFWWLFVCCHKLPEEFTTNFIPWKTQLFHDMRVIPPNSASKCCILLFYSNFQRSLTSKIQRSNRIRLTDDRCRKTYKLDEGGGHVWAHALTSSLSTSSDNRGPHRKPQQRFGSTNRSSKPRTHSIAHAKKFTTTILVCACVLDEECPIWKLYFRRDT